MDHFREAHILPFLKIIGLDGEEESNELENEESWWVLKVGNKIKVEMQSKTYRDEPWLIS